MSASYLKVLAAGLLVAAGAGVGFGPGWLATADAQPPGQPPTQPAAGAGAKRLADLEAEVKRLRDERDAARAAAEKAEYRGQVEAARLEWLTVQDGHAPAKPGLRTAKWEYDLADMETAYDKGAFERFLQQKENDGWEFLGSTTGGPSGGKQQWLFRRPVRAARAANTLQGGNPGVADLAGSLFGHTPPGGIPGSSGSAANPYFQAQPGGNQNRGNPSRAANTPPAGASPLNDAASIQAEIDRLTAELKKVQVTAGRMVFPKDALALDPKEVADLLRRLADRKYGKGKVAVSSSDNGVAVDGDKEALEWAHGVVKALKGQSSGEAGGVPPPAGRQ